MEIKKMARASNLDPIVTHHSSIALLQERFRQLQKAKEMREEQKLLKMLSEPKVYNYTTTTTTTSSLYEPFRLFFQPELLIPTNNVNASQPQLSLSLWPTSNSSGNFHFKCKETTNLWNPRKAKTSSSPSLHEFSYKLLDKDDFDSSNDVDTSLHL